MFSREFITIPIEIYITEIIILNKTFNNFLKVSYCLRLFYLCKEIVDGGFKQKSEKEKFLKLQVEEK